MSRRQVLPLAYLALSLVTPACNCGKQALASSQGLTVTPAALDFGNVTVGASATQALALSNGGTGTLNLLSATIAGDANFTLVGFSAPLAIQAGQGAPIQVQFAPTSAGPHQATLTITSDTGQRPETVSLTGVGVIYSVTLAPAALDFGCLIVDGGSAQQTVTVTNASSLPETVSVGQVAGGGDFRVQPQGAQPLDAGASLALTVSFTPTANEAETATVSVSACASCPPVVLTLQGTGAAVSLSATPSFVSFGTVPTGLTSTSTPVTLQVDDQPASCDLPVALTGLPSMKIGSDGFAPSPVGSWPSGLDDGGTAQLEVEYTGQAAGSANADWVLVPFSVQGEPQAPLAIPVNAGSSASPCGQLVVKPTSVDFGTVAVGSDASQTLTVTNNGQQSCTLSSIAISQNDPFNEFSLASGTPSQLVLAPGGAAPFGTQFAPSDDSPPLARKATLTLTTTDLANPSVAVPLLGDVNGAVVDAGGCSGSSWTAVPAGSLLDVDWGLDPGWAESKSGPAVVGAGLGDVWTPTGSGYPASLTDYTTSLVWANGTAAGVTAESLNLPWTYGLTTCDAMLGSYSYSETGSTADVELRGLPPGTYDLYIYAASNTAGYNTGFGVNVYSQIDGGTVVQALPALFTSANPYDATWVNGNQYVLQSGVCVPDGGQVEVAMQNGVQGSGNAGLFLSGMQIVQTSATVCDGGI